MGNSIHSMLKGPSANYANSELLWAVYAFIQAAESSSNQSYMDLAKKWQTWMDYTKTTAAHVRLPLCS